MRCFLRSLFDHSSASESSLSASEDSDTSSTEVDDEWARSSDVTSPTDEDVFATRTLLIQFVPLELADFIIDIAQYWPCVSVRKTKHLQVTANYRTENNAAAYYLVTPHVPTRYQRLEVKMVKFTLESCDQGWGGDARTYNGSFTWFEAGVIRGVSDSQESKLEDYFEQLGVQNEAAFNADAFSRDYAQEVVNPFEDSRRWYLQCNMQVSSLVRTHEIVWRRHDVVDDAAEALLIAKGTRKGCSIQVGKTEFMGRE
ncbi:hypothetical protein H0H87_007553 [Tephrocybe sp. NHM501043]|nr:hypothetical protein H0H87_007553 [Tephrocybe sp. NHM501043]